MKYCSKDSVTAGEISLCRAFSLRYIILHSVPEGQVCIHRCCTSTYAAFSSADSEHFTPWLHLHSVPCTKLKSMLEQGRWKCCQPTNCMPKTLGFFTHPYNQNLQPCLSCSVVQVKTYQLGPLYINKKVEKTSLKPRSATHCKKYCIPLQNGHKKHLDT